MPHEITMPQLGMAQDSGIIVNWLKNPGDAVQADEILMEVETDKTTMEVEVGHTGFLTEIRAEPGVPVPVGDVIAVISDKPGDGKPVAPAIPIASPETSAPETAAMPEDRSQALPVSAPAAAETAAWPTPDREPLDTHASAQRILASPKARVEAHRRGIDLLDLVRSGMRQPFHVADLDRFTPEPARAPASAAEMSMLRTDIDRGPFEAFLAWASDRSDGAVTPQAVWMAFLTGAWRRALGHTTEQDFVVEFKAFGADGASVVAVNTDLSGLSTLEIADGGRTPDLVIRDMTGTALMEHRPGGSCTVPVLVLTGADAQTIAISLYFREEDLPLETAAAILDGIAERAAEPIRHLL